MSSFYLQDPNGPSAESILAFSDSVILLILPIAFGVLAFLCSLLFKVFSHRALVEHQALEFTWTLLPAISLLLLAAPSLSLLYLLDEVGFPTSTSKIVGHQWYWEYESSDLCFFQCESYLFPGPLRLLNTDSSLSVTSSSVLRLLVTSADVLHSWTIPSWGLKADAVPGRLNQISTYLERPGLFYGQCSEICGSNHSFMPISAFVVTPATRHYL